MNKNIKFILFIIAISYFFSFILYSYDVPLPEDEAPAALFSVGMDEDDVELYIEGTWTAELSGSWGFGYSDNRGFFQDSSHVSIPVGFQFQQSPDITLSLWLFDRFFIETMFSEDLDSATYLAGYQGEENDFLQSVRVGNTGVSMDSYALWKVPDISENGIGISGAVKTPNSFHESLLRFDSAETISVEYLGKNRLDEELINPEIILKTGSLFFRIILYRP